MGLDRLILGSNPLYGVDHFSSERARERSARLNTHRRIEVAKVAFSAGATGFNFSPHPAISNILKGLKEEGYSKRIGLYPILPDTQTYITSQLNSGTTGMIKQLLGDLGVTAGARALVQGGLTWLTTDPVRAMRLYIDIEVERLTDIMPINFGVKAVMAHEIISDMALALGLGDLLRSFVEHLHDKHNLQAGFVTRNLPRFVDFLQKVNVPVKDQVIMTPVNKVGFQMTPSRHACEGTITELRGENIIAMSVLAGGQIDIDEAMNYLATLRNLASVAVGVSTERHADETFKKLSKLWGS